MDITKAYAKSILRATELREGYYNNEAADLENESCRRKCSDSEFLIMPNFASSYMMDMEECCKMALKENGLPEEMYYPMYLAFDSWNDINDWANRIIHE